MSTEMTWGDIVGAASPAISIFKGMFKIGKYAVDRAREKEIEEKRLRQMEELRGDSYVFHGEVSSSNVGGRNNEYRR